MVYFKRKAEFFLCMAVVLAIFIGAGPSFSAEPKPGDIIDSSNIEQYKDYLPVIMYGFIKDGWEFTAPCAIHVKSKTNVDVPSTYADATKNNFGTVTLDPDGSIKGLVAGMPFPDPREPNKALKIIWNHFYRWRGDCFSYNEGFYYTNQRKGGQVISYKAQIDQLFFSHRTTVDPKPILPSRDNLYSALWLVARSGPTKDMVTLSWRYNDANKSDDMWSYIPTLRRTIRMMSSERGNPVRATPFTWDDFYLFDGRPLDYTPQLIGEPKMLALVDQQTKSAPGTKYEFGYAHPVVSGPSDPYEIRNIYVVDMIPKNPHHPEQKKTLFVDNSVYQVMYSHVYDKSGNLWKGGVNGICKYTTDRNQPGWTLSAQSLTDLKNGFWSQFLLNTVSADGRMNMDHFHPATILE